MREAASEVSEFCSKIRIHFNIITADSIKIIVHNRSKVKVRKSIPVTGCGRL
jgi:hypothetical protein